GHQRTESGSPVRLFREIFNRLAQDLSFLPELDVFAFQHAEALGIGESFSRGTCAVGGGDRAGDFFTVGVGCGAGAEGIEPGAQGVAVDPEIGGDRVDRGSRSRLVQHHCVTLELLGVGLAWHGGTITHFPSVMLVSACPPPGGQVPPFLRYEGGDQWRSNFDLPEAWWLLMELVISQMATRCRQDQRISGCVP